MAKDLHRTPVDELADALEKARSLQKNNDLLIQHLERAIAEDGNPALIMQARKVAYITAAQADASCGFIDEAAHRVKTLFELAPTG